MENYKTEFLNKKESIQKNNPKMDVKNTKNSFFTKLIGKQNIGIQFNKSNM
jgi:hypothetical protein